MESYKVVGVTFEDRQELLCQLFDAENRGIYLLDEPDNQYDSSAIAVMSRIGKIGYIARDKTDEVRGRAVIDADIKFWVDKNDANNSKYYCTIWIAS